MVEQIIVRSLNEALEHLDRHPYKIYAGGTDLLIQSRAGAGLPLEFKQDILYCAGIKELNYIRSDGDHVYIGAMTTLTDILASEEVPQILKDAIAEMASPAIRNTATLAGNLGNASPAADSIPPLVVLDAFVKCQSRLGSRVVHVQDFFIGLKKTDLKENEMITEVIVPKEHFNNRFYRKVGTRKADALSKVSIAGLCDTIGGKILDIRIALGAVNTTVVRLQEVESDLSGRTISEVASMAEEIALRYQASIHPINDQRSNKEYRMNISLRLIESFLRSLK